MKSWVRKALTILIAITATVATSMAQGMDDRRPDRPSELLSKGISCLVSEEWVADDLRELGLKAGDVAMVRAETASIPGTSPETPDVTNVMFLSPNGRKGWLLFFKLQRDGPVTAIRNGYRLKRTKEGWSASEGNGGVATYKAMSLYVAGLSRKPLTKVTLKPSTDACHVE